MSHFECCSNLRFWRSTKVEQVVQIGGREGGEGGGEVIWTKSKRTAVFFGIKGRHQKLLNGFFQLRELFWAA